MRLCVCGCVCVDSWCSAAKANCISYGSPKKMMELPGNEPKKIWHVRNTSYQNTGLPFITKKKKCGSSGGKRYFRNVLNPSTLL